MICPHCGKEIENTITINQPANVAAGGCNPIPTTFTNFQWNGAANGTASAVVPNTVNAANPINLNTTNLIIKYP